MSKNNIHLLFPTPILVDNIGRPFTVEEQTVYETADYKYDSNNSTSTLNTVGFTRTPNIIIEQRLLDIHDFIISKATEYLKAYDVKDKVKLKIHRSWLVKSESGAYGRKHKHPNSLLSGVLYFKTFPKSGNLIIHDNKTSKFGSIELSYSSFNPLNSSDASLPPSDGMIVIFPSTTLHEVGVNESQDTRYSLAFDIWASGLIGSSNTMTELTI
jgi:uncharacterized protein (TIGR02466 family)